jgi:hypothetical protein
MSTLNGNALHSFPTGVAIGNNHTVINAVGRGGPVVAAVPPPGTLTINGITFTIDVKQNGPVEIVNLINSSGRSPGLFASLDRDYHLKIDGVNSISGNAALRTLLGI